MSYESRDWYSIEHAKTMEKLARLREEVDRKWEKIFKEMKEISDMIEELKKDE